MFSTIILVQTLRVQMVWMWVAFCIMTLFLDCHHKQKAGHNLLINEIKFVLSNTFYRISLVICLYDISWDTPQVPYSSPMPILPESSSN